MDDGTIVYLGLNDWMDVIWLFSKYGSNQTRDFYRTVLIEAQSTFILQRHWKADCKAETEKIVSDAKLNIGTHGTLLNQKSLVIIIANSHIHNVIDPMEHMLLS